MEYGEERGPELRADDGEEGEVGGAVGHGHQVVERRQELHPKGQPMRIQSLASIAHFPLVIEVANSLPYSPYRFDAEANF